MDLKTHPIPEPRVTAVQASASVKANPQCDPSVNPFFDPLLDAPEVVAALEASRNTPAPLSSAPLPAAPEGELIESWRKVWRDGFAPLLSTLGLHALRNALKADDFRLTQGSTTTPPPLMCVQDWPVEGACALGYCGWQGEGLETVGEVEEFFARSCYEADQRLGEPAACRWFLNWFDDTPRDQMRRELLGEVERTLADRFEIAAEGEEPADASKTAAA